MKDNIKAKPCTTHLWADKSKCPFCKKENLKNEENNLAVISKKTLKCIEKSIKNMKRGERSKTSDLTKGICDGCGEFGIVISRYLGGFLEGFRCFCEKCSTSPVVFSKNRETALLELVDGAYDVVELWNATTPSQKVWKKAWLKKARELGANPSI